MARERGRRRRRRCRRPFPGGADAVAAGDARLQARVRRAGEQWRRLGLYLRSVTPRDVLRLLLIALAVYAVWWLATSSWPALLPFVVGGVVGYAVLPIVNALDRVIPRPLAALLTMTGVIALLALSVAVLIPPLAEQLFKLYQALPSLDELRDSIEELRSTIGTLPPPTQQVIRDTWAQATATVRTNAELALSRAVELTIAGLLGLFSAISFFLGLLVIPTWVLSVMSDQRRASQGLYRLLPEWLQPDVRAVLRIVDRAFGTFIRGQLTVSLAVGLLTYAGLASLAYLGLPVSYPVVLAVVATLFQLVPQLGPLVSGTIAFAVGLATGPETALAVLALYFLVQRLVGAFVGSRVERQVTDLHPAILVLVIVALSQLGPLWVF
ncbi:MAG TPA: AI-2E family transporter, partial [Chloroflexota bacterium]|nr:AI-2E family transporter [Chloroflexota bacterium]